MKLTLKRHGGYVGSTRTDVMNGDFSNDPLVCDDRSNVGPVVVFLAQL